MITRNASSLLGLLGILNRALAGGLGDLSIALVLPLLGLVLPALPVGLLPLLSLVLPALPFGLPLLGLVLPALPFGLPPEDWTLNMVPKQCPLKRIRPPCGRPPLQDCLGLVFGWI